MDSCRCLMNMARRPVTRITADNADIEIAVVSDRWDKVFVLIHAAPDNAKNVWLKAGYQDVHGGPGVQFQFFVALNRSLSI